MFMEREKLGGFKRFLTSIGHRLLDPHGNYEVMRWKGEPGEPMPIIHRSTKTAMLTVGKGAEKYWTEYLRYIDRHGY